MKVKDVAILKAMNAGELSCWQKVTMSNQLSEHTIERISLKSSPSCLSLFQTETEKTQSETGVMMPRDKWGSTSTFLMAGIGSAVGLGNFWRFPYLTYKHGGAQFFLPYLLSVIFVGIPLLIMEIGLG